MGVDLDWEDIDTFHSRAKVPGGWILKAVHEGRAGFTLFAMVFVPDPEHKWVKEEKPPDAESGS